MVDHLPRTGLRDELAAWPAPVRAELERRAAIVRAQARGAVLDLDDPAARREVVASGSSSGEAAATDVAGTYDTIISVAALVEFADLPAAIRGLDRLLHPDGELFFIEPVARPGWVGLAGASLASLHPALRGHHLGRDVPLAIRASPFIITDIERFTMSSSLWPLRPFVHGRAMRFAGVAR